MAPPPAASPRSGRPLRVALVGLGPKGLFALERLLDRVGDAPVDVVAYEPHPTPGAGPVYDPAQPDWLRMNNAARHVDLWWPGNATVPAAERRSFVAWDGGRHGGGDAFVPRAVVGRYLADGLATLLRHAGPVTTVRVVRARVGQVVPAGAGWRVVAEDGAGAVHDEVLLATGHARPRDPRDPGLAGLPVPVVPAVFPVGDRLGGDAVPDGAVVALRGFALTAIDAALALTEGRGGRFVPGTGRRLRYVAGADGVGALVPFSRTGLPMVAKPDPAPHPGTEALDVVGETGRELVASLPGRSVDAVDGLRAAVAATATAALLAVGAPGDPAMVAVHPAVAPAGPATPTPVRTAGGATAARLAASLDVAVGLRPPGADWALGHAWRALYPAVVDRFGGTALDAAGWVAFRALAADLERIAFGPSAENVAKVLALAEAGVLDLDHVDGALLTRAAGDVVVRSGAGERRVDVVVDAVLPGPGVPPGDDGPLAGLVATGAAHRPPGRRGVDVDAAGGCRDAAGRPVPGLSVVGRPTEDVVVGHDTLSRTLHRQADGWARRVAARAREHATLPPAGPEATRTPVGDPA
ncbi:unannotated protein [freshwater metagenome]|uniref:Unannotated protein n=1 Tax=freshwater metagenome TaxID=449393 RepID=A0A6J7K3H2_9ZZZZ|nr:hypothetical protein [Actinomycetota bacterium]